MPIENILPSNNSPSLLPPPPQSWYKLRGEKPSVASLVESTKEVHCMVDPLIGKLEGGATVYNATGNKTASGLDYGAGVAIAPALRAKFPYRSRVKITNLSNGRTIETVIADTGNFGVGAKYQTIDLPNFGTVNRLIDLPTNLANELGVTGATAVSLEQA